MARRKRNPANVIYYARGRRRDPRSEDQAEYLTPERPRRTRKSSKATPVTSPAPEKH